MDVTIAVCTWNRVTLLARTLEEFARLRTCPGLQWEVLVIDNGSTDGTADFLRSLPTPAYPFRWVTEPRLGLSAARNRALAESDATLLFYTDDDVLLDPGMLLALVDAAERWPDRAAFGGVIEPWFPEEPDPTLLAAFPALRRGFCGLDLGLEEAPLPNGRHVAGANMAYRRSQVQGLTFREDLGPKGAETIGGDELDFQDHIRARGGEIIWVPGMRLKHYVDPSRMTLPYLLRFTEDAGRKYVRLHGVPQGPRVRGIPRWILGIVAKEYARASVLHLLRRRADALAHRRKAAEFAGMAKECLALHTRQRAVTAPSATVTSGEHT